MKTELETFYSLVEDIDTAMMTTRRSGRASALPGDGESEAGWRG